MMTAAIIVAAGRGLRMAGMHDVQPPGAPARSKQYFVVAGRPILAHAIERFESTPGIKRIVLVVPPGDEQLCEEELVRFYGFRKVTAILAGGAERQESVARGLAGLPTSVELVAVHDGVRPCVTPEQIAAVMAAASAAGIDGAVLAVPSRDTPKEVGDDRVIRRTLPRHEIWLAQTPQVFRRAVLEQAHAAAAADGYAGTDDAALVERAGYRVAVVEGSSANVKITTSDDLLAAEEWLSRYRPVVAEPAHGAHRHRV